MEDSEWVIEGVFDVEGAVAVVDEAEAEARDGDGISADALRALLEVARAALAYIEDLDNHPCMGCAAADMA